MIIQFTVEGRPQAQGRPRVAYRGGRVILYDPTSSRAYKQLVATTGKINAPEKLLECDLICTIKIYREVPKSFSKKKKVAALNGTLRPETKPDLKNYIAGIEDALEGVIYKNDSQIVGYGVGTGKYYGSPARVEIKIEKRVNCNV